jgi:single-stranded-DNA-specific exonuclease
MLEAAMARLAELLARQGAGAAWPRDLRLDGLLDAGCSDPALIEEIERAGPFGQGAPAPRFAFAVGRHHPMRRMGESHLRSASATAPGPPWRPSPLAPSTARLAPVEAHGGLRLHLAGKLELNHWGGRTRVQMRLDDAARP